MNVLSIRLRENDITKLFGGPDQVGLGMYTHEPGTSEQTMQTADLLRATTGHLLSRLDPEANARGKLPFKHTV